MMIQEAKRLLMLKFIPLWLTQSEVSLKSLFPSDWTQSRVNCKLRLQLF